MADWFYSNDNQQMGPVSQAELKNLAASGQLKPTDLVWTEGMDDWARASKVSGLAFGEEKTETGAEPAPFAFTADRPSPLFGKPEEKRGPRVPDWDDDAPRRSDADLDADLPRRDRWDSDDRPPSRRRPKKKSDAKIALTVVLSVLGGIGVLVVIALVVGRLAEERLPPPKAQVPPAAPMPFQLKNQGRVRQFGPPFPAAPKDQKLSSAVAPIRLDETQNSAQAKFNADDAVDAFWPKCFCKVYTFPMVAKQSYVIDMESNEFEAFLRLEDPHSVPLTQDMKGGGGRNARIFVTAFESGDFRIVASTFREGATGNFLVRVDRTETRFHKRPGQKDFTEVEPIRLKEKQLVRHDQLTDSDAFAHFRGGACCKVYTYPMVKGRTYTITMESGFLDAYLRLEDPAGTVLKEDDDSGGGRNLQDACIVFTAEESGPYRIVATTFDPKQRGSYVLRINAGK